MSKTKACILVFILALFIRLPLALIKAPPAVKGAESVKVAVSLATNGTYANAFGDNTGPTAHLLPGNVLIQALTLKLAGLNKLGAIALIFLACLEVSIGIATLPAIGYNFFGNIRIGLLAGIIGAVLPTNWWAQTSGQFEGSLAFMMISFSLLILSHYKSTTKKPSVSELIFTGIFSGATILITASIIPIFIILTALLFLLHKLSMRNTLQIIAIITITTIATTSPWVYRNYVVFDHFIPLRSNFGLELQVSNNEHARPLLEDNLMSKGFLHPYINGIEREIYMTIGEYRYNKLKLDQATTWIRNNFKDFLQLSLQRVMYFWFPAFGSVVQGILSGIVTCLAFLALALLFAKNLSTATIFAGYLFGFSSIYVIIQSSARYRLPIEGILLILASYLILSVYDKIVHRHKPLQWQQTKGRRTPVRRPLSFNRVTP